ncbi:MAG: PaaI family thioesterase [Chloroflexota bacterium]
MELNPAYVQRLIEVVNSSAFPSHLPFWLESIAFDESTVKMKIGPEHFQPLGTVHGGILATLIDTATYWAPFLRIPADAGMVNVDLKLNYLKAVTGGLLIAEGRCLRTGRTINYAEASVKNENGNLVAHGTSTLMVLPEQGLDLGVEKFCSLDTTTN